MTTHLTPEQVSERYAGRVSVETLAQRVDHARQVGRGELRHVETMLALLRGFLEEDEASLPIPEPAEVEATVEAGR